MTKPKAVPNPPRAAQQEVVAAAAPVGKMERLTKDILPWMTFGIVLFSGFGSLLSVGLVKSDQCHKMSEEAIAQYQMLRDEVMDRRQRFVDRVGVAKTLGELRLAGSPRDSLHGFNYHELRDRSLKDLENEEIRIGGSLGLTSTPSLMRQAEFTHAIIAGASTDEDHDATLRRYAVMDALETHDVSGIDEADLPALKRAAAIESGWLIQESVHAVGRGIPYPDCNAWTVLGRLGDGDTRDVHVIFGPLPETVRNLIDAIPAQ